MCLPLLTVRSWDWDLDFEICAGRRARAPFLLPTGSGSSEGLRKTSEDQCNDKEASGSLDLVYTFAIVYCGAVSVSIFLSPSCGVPVPIPIPVPTPISAALLFTFQKTLNSNMPRHCELAGCSNEAHRRQINDGDTRKRLTATICRPCWIGLEQELESTNTSESRRTFVNSTIAKQPYALKVDGNFFHVTPGFENKSNGVCAECGRLHNMPSPVLCFQCRTDMSFKAHDVDCDKSTHQKLLARLELSKELYNKWNEWKKTQSRDKNRRRELRTEQEIQEELVSLFLS